MRTDRSKQIQLYVALSVLILALISNVFAHGVTTVPTEGNLLKEVEAPMPDYPKSVWDESPVGEVTLMFDVNEEGHVEDPCIVSSTFSGTFDLYAVKAIKGHRYEQLGGPSQHMKGVKKTIFLYSRFKSYISGSSEVSTTRLGTGSRRLCRREIRSIRRRSCSRYRSGWVRAIWNV